MTIDDVIGLGQRAMLVTLLAASPMLIAGMVVGLIISLFQSVTQIQEITLTFVPKIVAVLLAFAVFAPWMADVLIVFVKDILGNFDTIVF